MRRGKAGEMGAFEIRRLINAYHEAAGTAEYDRLLATFGGNCYHDR